MCVRVCVSDDGGRLPAAASVKTCWRQVHSKRSRACLCVYIEGMSVSVRWGGGDQEVTFTFHSLFILSLYYPPSPPPETLLSKLFSWDFVLAVSRLIERGSPPPPQSLHLPGFVVVGGGRSSVASAVLRLLHLCVTGRAIKTKCTRGPAECDSLMSFSLTFLLLLPLREQ